MTDGEARTLCDTLDKIVKRGTKIHIAGGPSFYTVEVRTKDTIVTIYSAETFFMVKAPATKRPAEPIN